MVDAKPPAPRRLRGSQGKTVPKKSTKIRLNLDLECGRKDTSSGIQELVQNWFHSILQRYKVTTDDVVVKEETTCIGPDDKETEKSTGLPGPEHSGIRGAGASSDRQHKKLVFFASIRGKKPGPCVVGIIRFTDCVDPLLGSKLELINIGVTLKRNIFQMVTTSKAEDKSVIGGHGEGMKAGIVALMRNGHNVIYHTNAERWDFKNENGLFAIRTKLRSDENVYDHNCDKNTHVLVEGPSLTLEDIKLDRFLFLRPPLASSILQPKDPVERCISGYVCTSESVRGLLFIKGLFVKAYTEGTRNHLYYGYNIIGYLKSNRDRDPPEGNLLSEKISWIWGAMLLDEYSSVYARKTPVPSPSDSASNLYLTLLEKDETCIDVADVERHFGPKKYQGEKIVKILLFTYLLRQRKASPEKKVWLYGKSTGDSDRQCQIIRDLQLEPVPLPDALFRLFEGHQLIRTIYAERERVFKLRTDTIAFESPLPFPHHVRHLLSVLRASHPSTQKFAYIWKDGKDIDLDILPSEHTIYLNDRNLSVEYVHREGSVCVAYDSRTDNDDNTFICDCSVFGLASQIADHAMHGLPPDEIRHATALNRSLVALCPHSLKIKHYPQRSSAYERQELTWTGLGPSSFTILIKPGRGSLNYELKLPSDDHESDAQLILPDSWSVGQDLWTVIPRGIASELNYITTEVCMATLTKYHPGRVYTIQVRANSDRLPVSYSQPFHYECPLDSVDALKAEMRAGTLFVSYSAVPGACKYEITTIFHDESRVTVISDCTQWSKSLSNDSPIRVEVFAVSPEGVRSYKLMFVNVIPNPTAPSDILTGRLTTPLEEKNSSLQEKSSSSQKPSGEKAWKGKDRHESPFCDDRSDIGDQSKDIEYGIKVEDESDDDDTDDEDWVEHVIGRSPSPKAETMKQEHDQTTVHGSKICRHDVLEVELETSKSHRRFVHFVIYVEMISEIRNTKSDPKITLEVLKYLSVHDFLDPTLGKNPQNYRSIKTIPDKSPEFLLVPDEVGGTMAKISVGDIKSVAVLHRDRRPRASHLVTRFKLPISGFRCEWVLQVDHHVREHLYPLKSTDKTAHPEKPACPISLATGDFFCGAGGFSEGFKKAEFEIVVGVDNNMHASDTWKKNHSRADAHFTTVETFLLELKKKSIMCPNLTVALISPPCQGFSAANPGGKDDNDNREALSISSRVLTATDTYYGLIENVTGLSFPSHLHHLHKVMIDCMKAGYQSRWAILNAKEYGVPTIRRRLFLVVAKLGLTLPAFPEPSVAETEVVTLRDAIKDLDIHNPREDANSGNPVFMRDQESLEMLTPYAVAMDASAKVENHAISSASVEGWPVAKWDEPACTIRTSCSNRWACVHPEGKRRLSPRECARIMSFPDTYSICGAVSDQHAQIGNAVAPKMAQALGETFMEAILTDFPSLRTAGRSEDAQEANYGSSSILGKRVRINENPDNDMILKRCRKRSHLVITRHGT